MGYDGYHALIVGLTQLFLGGYVLALIEFRPPRHSWRCLWIGLIVLVVAGNVTAILLFDFWDAYYGCKMGFFTVTAPYILITLWCSQHRDLRSAFGIATALLIGFVGGANGSLAELLFPESALLPLLVRLLSFPALFLLLHRFSAVYREMLQQLEQGWLLLNTVPVGTCMLAALILDTVSPRRPLLGLLLEYGLLALCGCTYCVIYLFFIRIKKDADNRQSQKLLEMQISALQSRMEAVKLAEEAVRVERHDLRHRFRTIAELVNQGKTQEALAFIGAAQKQLEEAQQPPVRWCRPPILNAVFSSYFGQARHKDIRVEAHIALADRLPVEEAELAIVFSNALENAVHACMRLPEAQREICCKVIAYPDLMFEISNPYAGTVRFDPDGLPVPAGQGQGIGSRSIAAFCRKHGACYRYAADNGRFSLRVIL